MTVAENMALSRRVEKLERQIMAVAPRRVRTWLEVCRRGEEPVCRTVADVERAAELPPAVEVVGRALDLDVLIDSETGTHLHRAANDTTFDEIADGVEVIDVVIRCYPEQAEQITSDRRITATSGGTRAGKTRVLVWWLFRQWLIRGHGIDPEAEDGEGKGATFWWVREDSTKLWKHAILPIMNLWPDVFVGKRPSKSTKDPILELFDGSTLEFKHAAHSGSKAGTSLRSESVQAMVVDELSAIHHEENWREMKSRVAQTAGPIATAFTPTTGHWSEQLERQAMTSGGAVTHRKLTCFQNPWWPRARVWSDLLLGAVTGTELEQKILAAPDPVKAALEVVTDPDVRRMRFGEKQMMGTRLWKCWDAERYTIRDEHFARDSFGGLPNTTATAIGGLFPSRGRKHYAGGKDFNVEGGAAIFYQCFGDPRRPTVLIFDEVVGDGPTAVQAEAIADRYPGAPLFCDPTGAMDYRHASHGARSSTDAEEMRAHGLDCEPANSYRENRVEQLGQLDSLNVLHRAMNQGLIYVHSRCTRLLASLDLMQAKPDGRIAKASGRRSTSDLVSGPGDAMRYGLWPVYRDLQVRDIESRRRRERDAA